MDPAEEIEQAAFALQKPMNDVIERGDSSVQQFYRDATVFVTGGSGFIGKQLIEKLLRSCAIKKIYVLMRPRKGRTIQERLNHTLKEPVYDNLRSRQPQFADKIVPVEGDVADIRLGLSEKDWNTLADEVTFIFHVAATIRFDEPLRKATLTNVRSTREALALARECKSLIKFVHVSTAFAFVTKDRIGEKLEEQFYTSPMSPETIISLAETVDESRLDAITQNLIGNWPNTYTFTKAISEELIRTTAGDLPVCIVRPAMVLPSYIEPAPGWLDIRTVIGPSGIIIACGLGVVKVFQTDVNSDVAVVPVDLVNNAIIAAAWDSSKRPRENGQVPIYAISRSTRYGYFGDILRKYSYKKMSIPAAVWRAETIEVKNQYLYVVLAFFLNYIPAIILDIICFIIRKKPKGVTSFVDLYRKVDKLGDAYKYFINNSWSFKTDNLEAMFQNMSEVDRIIFNCDFLPVDIIEYTLIWGMGVRRYILKDGLKNTEYAFKKQQVFKVLNYIVLVLYAYVIWWVMKTVFQFVSSFV
ncbi:fatty acyl-CoA reductase wat-like [Anticarsia gemmatalis]|uniref:fatty acyl-CoA reductase wat-like n=1 Tax=Anticarsia gemmatalis TaxID=129554 RepID=UPI003F76A390